MSNFHIFCYDPRKHDTFTQCQSNAGSALQTTRPGFVPSTSEFLTTTGPNEQSGPAYRFNKQMDRASDISPEGTEQSHMSFNLNRPCHQNPGDR